MIDPRAPALGALVAVAVVLPPAIRENCRLVRAESIPVGLHGLQSAASGSVSGRVVEDTSASAGIAGVEVALSGRDAGIGRTALTGADGSFAFADLPQGTYLISATRAGFLPSLGGAAIDAAFPELQSIAVNLDPAAAVRDVRVRMIRTAAITGRVTDERGAPVGNVLVEALRFRAPGNTRPPTRTDTASTRTDDRGEYRLHSLAPGRYVVAASDLSLFFPGTSSASTAGPVEARAGEASRGIDLRAFRSPSSAIAGTMARADGGPIADAEVFLLHAEPLPFGRPARRVVVSAGTGAFRFDEVTSGRYTLVAHMRRPDDSGSDGAAFWSITDVDVRPETVHRIHVDLQPGATVTGRVRADGFSAIPPEARTGRIRLTRTRDLSRASAAIGFGTVEGDGTFQIRGVPPGDYVIAADGARPTAGGVWSVSDAMLDGRSVTDAPFTVTSAAAVGEVDVTLANRRTELAGRFHAPPGAHGSDYLLVVFPTDPDLRGPWSRRLRLARPAVDGGFLVGGLPPGSYFMAMASAIDDETRGSPDFFRALEPLAVRVDLTLGQRTVQDLRAR